MKRTVLIAIALSVLALGTVTTRSLAQDPTGYSVRGSVVASSGQAVSSVWVILERDSGARRTLTADDGRYYLSQLRPGRYTLLVRRDRAILFSAQIQLPRDARYDIVLP